MGRALPVAVVAALLAAAASAGAEPPPFAGSVSLVTVAELRSSYRPGCPVGPAGLRLLHLTYWGFDGRPHRGGLVVSATVALAVTQVFARLYRERFPIRSMKPVAAYAGSDNRSLAADNTAGFNCRYAVATGPKRWSEHAYGEAIDVNPRENPYLEAGKVYPPAGRRYVDRSDVRAGMAVPGGELIAAFAAVGWQWGGRWTGSPDYQHFSATGG